MQIVDRLAITCNLYSSKHAFKKYRSCSQVTSFMPKSYRNVDIVKKTASCRHVDKI